jgi:hypothetical protein
MFISAFFTTIQSLSLLLEPSADVPAQAVPTSAEEHNSNQQELPIVHESASVPDIDVIADSEDIDAPTSVLAHVQLARTSRKSIFYYLRLNILSTIIDTNRREKACPDHSCISQRARYPTLG